MSKSGRPLSVLHLLDAAAKDRTDLVLADFSAEQVRWAVRAGLGPWLRRCTARDAAAPASPLWPLVHGADLTGRVIAAEQLDATAEILDACDGHAAPLTLLKGISVAEQYYPEPHLRVMGDIDLLVDVDALPDVRARLLGLGYRDESTYPPEFYLGHHHLQPLFHPRRRVWVELHWTLFPPTGRMGSERAFTLESVLAERRASTFRGRPVYRLGDELQLVYLAAHWAYGLNLERAMVGMLDVARLLTSGTPLHWERILEWIPASRTSSHVCLMLTYLARRGLVDLDPELLRQVIRRQRSFGRTTLQAIHAVIDRYVVGGCEFGPLMSERNVGILWDALLSPGPPARNVLTMGWNLLPSRSWLTRALGGRP